MTYCTTISTNNKRVCFNWQQKEGCRNTYRSTCMYIYYFVYTSLHVFTQLDKRRFKSRK